MEKGTKLDIYRGGRAMDAEVKWDGGLSFQGTAESGFRVRLAAEPAVGGSGDGFRPLELMLVSLAGCTAMDVISILQKKGQKVATFEVQVHAERAEVHPKVFTSIRVTYVLGGANLDRVAVERAIELSETRYCPAHAMLANAVPIAHSYEIRALHEP